MADSGDNCGLPANVDPKGSYILSGETLNAIFNAIKANRVKVLPDSGLIIKDAGATGTTLALDTDECPS